MKAWDLGHIITHYLNQRGDTVSHKKLQKLLYYVEAWHLVHMNKSIVDENFQAWVHGPVVEQLYHELKEHGFNNLKVIADENNKPAEEQINEIIKKNEITDDQLNLIFSVLNKYGGMSSLQLELLSHNEQPWLKARKGRPPHENCNEEISKEDMKNYFTTLE